MVLEEIIDQATETFKREIRERCENIDFRELTPSNAEEFTKAVKESLCESGKVSLRKFVMNLLKR